METENGVGGRRGVLSRGWLRGIFYESTCRESRRGEGHTLPLLHDKRRIVDNTLCAESDSMELCFYKLPSETNVEQGLCEGVIPYCPSGSRFLALAQQA